MTTVELLNKVRTNQPLAAFPAGGPVGGFVDRDTEELYREAIARGRLDIVRYLLNLHIPPTSSNVLTAVEAGQDHILNALITSEFSALLIPYVFGFVVESGSLSTFQSMLYRLNQNGVLNRYRDYLDAARQLALSENKIRFANVASAYLA
jgi:hypothetical protein